MGSRSGTCRECGCTEEKACVLSVLSVEKCSEILTPTRMRWPCTWVDEDRTRCSACFIKHPTIGTRKRTWRKITPPDRQLIVVVSRFGRPLYW